MFCNMMRNLPLLTIDLRNSVFEPLARVPLCPTDENGKSRQLLWRGLDYHCVAD